MTYVTSCVEVEKIDSALRNEMANIYFAHYDGSDIQRFTEDLEEKREAILLYSDGVLVGFTTWLSFDYVWRNINTKIIFSGDTVVDRAHWGQQALALAWIKRMSQHKLSLPDEPLYWFLLVKGHRTFKYLPAFSLSWYPHWSEYRKDLKELADELASMRYGELYDANQGVIKFHDSQGHLKTEIAFPASNELKNQAVKYFIAKNPNYYQGDELVCICEIEPNNMRSIALKIFNKVKVAEVCGIES